MKQSKGSSSVRAASTSAKRVLESGGDWKSRTSDMDMHGDSALDREMDELESDGCVVRGGRGLGGWPHIHARAVAVVWTV